VELVAEQEVVAESARAWSVKGIWVEPEEVEAAALKSTPS